MHIDYSHNRDQADEVPFERLFEQIGLVFGPGVNAFARTQSWSLWQRENQNELPDQIAESLSDCAHTGSLPPRFRFTSSQSSLVRSPTPSSSLSFPTITSPSFLYSPISSPINHFEEYSPEFLTDFRQLEYYANLYWHVILTYFLAACVFSMSWPLNGVRTLGFPESLARMEGYSIEDLLQPASLPIASVTEAQVPHQIGVLMISNIPYTVTRSEIATFIGRSARTLAPNQGCPIHIIMERSTGKTMDCFVEFVTRKDAKDTVDRINRNYDIGTAPRIGNRHVDVELSSLEKMMKAIFPLTKCIKWEHGKPILLENEFEWSTGFTGFLTDEELFGLSRHADQPHRSAFASKVPQRCYESFITTIQKFPWYATDLYTVYQRNKLFHTMQFMIETLVGRIKKQNTVGLDVRLLQELVQIGIACPGFNPRMKYCFAWWSEIAPVIQGLDQDWCCYFPFDTLNYVSGHDSTEIQFYAFLMSHGCVTITKGDGLVNQHGRPPVGSKRIYGQYFFEWNKEVSEELLFRDAIIYEAKVFRQFIITGFQRNRGRQLSISTIGTAPSSSPIRDDRADSERTVINSPRPVFRPQRNASLETVVQVSHCPSQVPEFSRDWKFPDGSSAVSRTTSHSTASESSVPHSAAERVQPYRPPHARASAGTSTAGPSNSRSQRGRESRQSHQSTISNMRRMPPPTYYSPHTTAHNIHSSSDPDPFSATSPVAPPSRSVSDASRPAYKIEGSITMRPRGPGHAKK